MISLAVAGYMWQCLSILCCCCANVDVTPLSDLLIQEQDKLYNRSPWILSRTTAAGTKPVHTWIPVQI